MTCHYTDTSYYFPAYLPHVFTRKTMNSLSSHIDHIFSPATYPTSTIIDTEAGRIPSRMAGTPPMNIARRTAADRPKGIAISTAKCPLIPANIRGAMRIRMKSPSRAPPVTVQSCETVREASNGTLTHYPLGEQEISLEHRSHCEQEFEVEYEHYPLLGYGAKNFVTR